MTKKEFIGAVAEKSGISAAKANEVVNATFETIADLLVSGDKIQINGFGSFETRDRAATTAKNPRTGEVINVPAKKVPAFKASSALKAKIG
ncbi:MAG: HU family DNA-binding protein [Clostridiales bacterium]|nr:HU family DNA-binding protein [Clostridiales bacterium]